MMRSQMMICPVCTVELAVTDRQGVEIDYCPQCRGVWLDRGELEKLIERSISASVDEDYRDVRSRRNDYSEDRSHEYRQSYPGDIHGSSYQDRHHDDHSRSHRKRKSFLGELFDF